MSGTLLMPVWIRRSWRPQGLISHKWVFGEAEGNSDMIKLVASRTSDIKVSLFSPSHDLDVACVIVSVMLDVM